MECLNVLLDGTDSYTTVCSRLVPKYMIQVGERPLLYILIEHFIEGLSKDDEKRAYILYNYHRKTSLHIKLYILIDRKSSSHYGVESYILSNFPYITPILYDKDSDFSILSNRSPLIVSNLSAYNTNWRLGRFVNFYLYKFNYNGAIVAYESDSNLEEVSFSLDKNNNVKQIKFGKDKYRYAGTYFWRDTQQWIDKYKQINKTDKFDSISVLNHLIKQYRNTGFKLLDSPTEYIKTYEQTIEFLSKR